MTDGRTKARNPTWSADGRRLFFVSNRGGTMELWQQQIGEIGAPVGEPVPITAGLGIRTAAFSPDGTKLAYSQGRLVSNVWRAPIRKDQPAAWADAEQITFDNAFAECFDVSPDGQRLVVSSDRAGNFDLWILASQGGAMTSLTTDPTADWCPQWSPDAKEIAFYSHNVRTRSLG
ncbi:MAG: hypothetical protein BMS9Abin37_1644 [Acidobacteriota bacterium]|nr:MAG: hypothetical protein BMS9Abin37_1644 [Acidobacteriota bacterium]